MEYSVEESQSKCWLFAGENWENSLSCAQIATPRLRSGKDGHMVQVVAIFSDIIDRCGRLIMGCNTAGRVI